MIGYSNVDSKAGRCTIVWHVVSGWEEPNACSVGRGVCRNRSPDILNSTAPSATPTQPHRLLARLGGRQDEVRPPARSSGCTPRKPSPLYPRVMAPGRTVGAQGVTARATELPRYRSTGKGSPIHHSSQRASTSRRISGAIALTGQSERDLTSTVLQRESTSRCLSRAIAPR